MIELCCFRFFSKRPFFLHEKKKQKFININIFLVTLQADNIYNVQVTDTNHTENLKDHVQTINQEIWHLTGITIVNKSLHV